MTVTTCVPFSAVKPVAPAILTESPVAMLCRCAARVSVFTVVRTVGFAEDALVILSVLL